MPSYISKRVVLRRIVRPCAVILCLTVGVSPAAYAKTHNGRRNKPTWAQRITAAAERSPMVLCIEWRESTSTPAHLRPWAVNGPQYGIAQWNESAWVEDHGLRYAGTPFGASGIQQEAVLVWSIEHGLSGEWTPWDGC